MNARSTYKALIGLLSFIAYLSSSTAFAATATTPEQELEQTQKDLQEAKQHQSSLTEAEVKLENELKTLQDKLVKTAETAQKTERELSDAEEKLSILSEQEKAKSDTLKVQQQHFSALVMAELSLSSTPPEAMLMMPEDPMDIIKAARALSMASDSIRQEAQSLAAQLAELTKLKDKVAEHRDQLIAIATTLDKQRHDLMTQLAERTELQKKLGLEEKQEEETLVRLAKKSADLQELVGGIEKEETKHAKPSANHDRAHMRSFADAKGHIRPPVAGQLVQKFGSSQGKNATSKGIAIATREHAEVTAPYDGEVVFSGPFLGYGRMVILRHSDDFHTLLAGFSKIDVEVGQFLLEGEPIGAMGDSDSENKNAHTLYIEIRKDNQPVDPTLWISGLKKMTR